MKPLYIFIDESGNFDFSKSGTKFYVFTAVITHYPYEGIQELTSLRYRILSGNLYPDLTPKYKDDHICNGFHATEDKQIVRDEVFSVIKKLKSIKVHSIVVRKNKCNPNIQDEEKFYSKMSGYLVDYIQKSYLYDSICVVFNGLASEKRKKNFIKSIKLNIKQKGIKMPHSVYFPKSSSHMFLDISDYICWAIYRKWEFLDERSYDIIKHHLGKPEFDIFAKGDFEYY